MVTWGHGPGWQQDLVSPHIPLLSPQLEPDSPLVWVLAGALGLSLVFSFVTVPAQCFQLGKAYGVCLLTYYLLFLSVALLTEFRVIYFSTP